MNIDHVSPDVDIPEGVLINHIFDHQLRLMGKYHDIETKNGINYPEPPWHIDDSKVQQILKDMFWRTTEEIAEAIEVVPDLVGKNWKETWDK